jgi:regulator of nucleoside diphosphate kinase
MRSSILLSTTDKKRLEDLFSHQVPGVPPPTQEQAEVIRALLDAATLSDDEEALEGFVGFHDTVTLVSPRDPRDSYRFSIVVPAEADLEEDRIPVVMPLALAVLGRRCGDDVHWLTPRCLREMQIAAVHKHLCQPA